MTLRGQGVRHIVPSVDSDAVEVLRNRGFRAVVLSWGMMAACKIILD
ncbi:hypothetical protein PA08_2137 [Cutibacterium modestum P08]|nr:hypothetical protein PA08_2137 [Cutibacterium modestum P08]